MTINLEPDLEKLIRDKVASGEYESERAVLEAALRLLAADSGSQKGAAASGERLAGLEDLFREAGRDPAPRTRPLPDEAFDRGNLYGERS